MISAEQFLAILEQKDLLPADVLTRLRAQIAQSDKPIAAEMVAKRLIERGYLTPAIAKRLLGEKPVEGTKPSPQQRPAAPSAPKPAEEDDLGLMPLPEEEPKAAKKEAKKPAKAPTAEKEDLDLVPLDEAPAKPAPTPAKKPDKPAPKPSAKPPAKPARPTGDQGSLLDEELPPLGDLGGLGLEPLDGLLDQAGFGAAPAGAGPLAEAAAAPTGPLEALPEEKPAEKKTKFRKKMLPENVWDSPLLLVGGGTLLLLVILGGVLVWVFMRQGGDELLRQADDEYRRGSYTQAIHKYGIYLREYPNHPQASLARVRRGLAQLRQTTDGATSWPKALDSAQRTLKEIAPEPEFKNEAQRELVALLPTIAQGLADQARTTRDPAMVAKTKEALALVEKYVPKSMRPATRLSDIQAGLTLTEREIARGDQLRKAIAGMRQAVKAGKTEEAYRVRDALLKQYPSLISDKDLVAAVLEVSRAAQSAVKNVDRRQEAILEDAPPKFAAAVALASRTSTAPPPGAEGHVVAVLAEGAVYGLEGSTGRVLWRRPVGYQVNGRSPSFPPTPVAAEPGSDLLLVEVGEDHHDVLRVEGASGRLRWRHPVAERFDAHPVVAGSSVLVATRSGRLVAIDLDSGVSPGYVQLPQSLRVAPCVDSARKSLYQVAEHSNLFVLPLGEAGVKQVVHLGHEAGSVTAPPTIISRFLIVIENNREEGATLRVFSLEGTQKSPPFAALQEIRLEGHVDTPPVATGLRMLVATDQGNLYVFEASASDVKNPLVQIGEGKAASEQEAASAEGPPLSSRYLLLVGSQALVADSQLTRYDLQAARGKLHPRGIHNEATAVLQPLVPLGQSVVHVRRRLGLPGVIASAINVSEGKPFWETHLASPLLGSPAVDASGRVVAATPNGAVFQLEAKSLRQSTVVDQPSAALPIAQIRQPMSAWVRFSSGLVALAAVNGPKQVAVSNPQAGQSVFRWIALPDPLGGRPIAFADALLACCTIGQVFLLDPESGAKRTEPFQPHLQSGDRLAWREPAVLGPNEFLLADSRSGLHRVGIKQEPTPHLAALATVKTREPIVSSLGVAGNVVYAMDGQKTLSAFDLPELALAQQWPLDGHWVGGPWGVGQSVLVVTYNEKVSDAQQLPYKLYCLNGGKKIVWQVDMPSGPPAGPPLALANKFVFASTGGMVWTVEASSGKTLAQIDVGQPLGTGPVLLEDQLLIGGHDGTLYLVKQP